MSERARRDRIGRIVGGVVYQAVQDGGANGIIVLDADSPEGGLLREWAAARLGAGHVHEAGEVPRGWAAGVSSDVAERELRRAGARVLAARHGWLLANPASKTALLLARELPPEALLPLGDLYASEVRDLAGGCTLPDDLGAIAAAAGGVGDLDRALHMWLEARHSLDDALAALPDTARRVVRDRLERNRSLRRWPKRVAKLTSRTLWIDVFA